jgi:predicted negative regulator of RcsB-dependent stress response
MNSLSLTMQERKMSVYMTEDEQVELIKSWWKRYNGIVIIVFSLVLLAISGYRYWHWHQESKVKQASSTYEQMMVAFANKDYKAVRGYSRQLVDEYQNTVYANAAQLTLAKIAVKNEKYKSAKVLLTSVITNSKSKVMIDVARIRIVRVLIEEKLYDDALSHLSKITETSYLPVVNELKGDIYSAKGNNKEAVAYYKEAQSEVEKNGIGNLFLEMKSNELISTN